MKKIMFNDKYGLTDAVLDGRKTMTRRVATWETVKEPNTGFLTDQPEAGTFELCDRFLRVAKSAYKIGEVVAVAQKYMNAFEPIDWVDLEVNSDDKGWFNKMFVRADLMPHQIRITDIKVERLQDISHEDCLKEGIMYQDGYFCGYKSCAPNMTFGTMTALQAFAVLIDKVNGKGTWENNPYVFAYTFELVK